MKRLGILATGLAAVAAIAATAFLLRPREHATAPETARPEGSAPAPAPAAAKPETAAKAAVATLYCEFTNFADRNPLVGFYFTIEENGPAPVYAQIYQREQDGTQDDFGGATAPRPQWSYDGAQSPPTISSPDGATQINLYGYDPNKPGSNWFEAGLRSIRYRNLGGKCRHSAA